MKVEKENMGTKDEEKIKKLKSFLEEYLNLKGVNTNQKNKKKWKKIF